jgi:hypothetical protein
MATIGGSNAIKSGLVLSLDAANARSYPGSGTVWNDLSGNNNSGSLVNGPTFNSINGGNIISDGVDDYVLHSSPTLTTFTVDITYSPLAFDTNPGTNRYNYILGSFGTNMFCRYNTANSGNNILIANHGGTDISLSNLGHVINGTYNMVITFDDSTKNTRVYINSSLISNTTYSATLRYQGNRQLVATFNSRIYSYKAYNRALSADEIAQNYNTQKSRFNL